MNRQQFIDRVRSTQVTCEICGHKDYALSEHIITAHDMDPVSYREKFEKARIASPIVAELLSQMHRGTQSGTLDTFLINFDPFFTEIDAQLGKVGQESGLSYASEFDYLIPEADPFYAFDHEAIIVATTGFKRRANVYAGGPTGCGKSELFLQMYNRMGLPALRVNMNGEVTPSDFIGSKDMKDDGSTYFKYGALPYCMKHGIALILDEIDFTPPHIASVLFPVLESKHRTLVIPGTNERIPAKDGFVVYATGNTGGKGDLDGVYTGTEVQNTAFLDRFAFKINMNYLELDKEVTMLMQRFPGFKKKSVACLVKFATDIREGFLRHELTMPLSTRRLVGFFEEVSTMGTQLAFKCMIMNWFDTSDQSLVEQIADRNDIQTVLKETTKATPKKVSKK